METRYYKVMEVSLYDWDNYEYYKWDRTFDEFILQLYNDNLYSLYTRYMAYEYLKKEGNKQYVLIYYDYEHNDFIINDCINFEIIEIDASEYVDNKIL